MSPRDKDGYFNSWERAKAHGGPWLTASDVHWLLYAPVGKTLTVRRRKIRLTRGAGGPDEYEMVQMNHRSFKTFDEAAALAVELYGPIAGWKRDRHGGYHPSDTPHPEDTPCVGYGLRVCGNRRKPGETMCGVHLNVIAKREQRRVESEARRERWARDSQLRKDCQEAAAKLGIPVGKGSHVSMHAEDFLALCRELSELRELREFA